jgi:glutamyl-tRNA reductase
VITSTGACEPIITRRQFEPLLKQRRYRPIFLIDIAMPRDIEPAVGELDNVYLYNIDDLQQVVAGTQKQRSGEVSAARSIVAREVEDFAGWYRAREMGPLIDRLYRRYQDMATEELSRTLNKLGDISPQEKQHLEELTRRIVNKLLHDPIRALRDSDALQGSTIQYLRAMERLFELTDEEKHKREE